jgi:serine/threonine protein phosphatase PrpC
MMRLQLATADYIGARSQQQDAVFAQGFGDRGAAVLILADGLGGHESGAEASRLVIDTFRDAAGAGAFNDGNLHEVMRQTLDAANDRIAGSVDPAHGQRSMASTAVVAVIDGGALKWISVGDSHLYVWRDGALSKLNEDHSQAGLMVKSGRYKEDDPEVLAVKSVLVSALTGRKLEIVDHPTEAFAVVEGDVVMLASDGLNTLSDGEIADIIAATEPEGATRICATLLESVRDRRMDRQDNTTVAVARVLKIPDQSAVEVPSAAPAPEEDVAPTVRILPSEAAPLQSAKAAAAPLQAAAVAEAEPPPAAQRPRRLEKAAPRRTERYQPPPELPLRARVSPVAVLLLLASIVVIAGGLGAAYYYKIDPFERALRSIMRRESSRAGEGTKNAAPASSSAKPLSSQVGSDGSASGQSPHLTGNVSAVPASR